uniref:Cyclotide mden-F n=1 Tax=Melicytus dentatus TaxID=491106 RepID=CYMEF_MELDN|nr:RecName: Full=Cyclotide mden-F [Melicytus dentatus]
GLPICGETCFFGKCNTPKCTCINPICYKN